MVVVRFVAPAVSVGSVEISVDLALTNGLPLDLVLLCCSADVIRKPRIVIVIVFCDSIGASSCASFW